MSSLFPRGKRLYACIQDVEGKWHQIRTDFTVDERPAAERWVTDREREVEEERARIAGKPLAMTVRRWVEEWSDDQHERGVVDWKRNKGWLITLVVPIIGDMLVRDVRTPHIVDLFRKIRAMPSEATGKPRAGRTMHNIHGVVRAMFNDAEIAGHIEHAPKPLDERQLGRKTDADPEWRESALFTRDEVQTMISSAKIPLDRRVLYAIELLAGTRPGEAAALRWRHYDASKQPLGGLRVARSYSARAGREKGTKTDAVKHVPVHPTLAAILAEWKLSGWAAMMGREPEPDDLIVPLPPADAEARTTKDGEPYRPDYYSRRRWVTEDEVALGWRHRRHYDTRATFVSIAVDDGADAAIIRERVTHTRPMRDGFDFYYRGDRWLETCREVAKLKVVRLRDPDDNVIPLRMAAGDDLRATVVQSSKSPVMSSTSGLRRRVSKAGEQAAGGARGESERAVTPPDPPPSSTESGPVARSFVQARCDAGLALMRAASDDDVSS